LRTHYHSFAPGLAVLLISLLSSGLLVLLIKTPARTPVAELGTTSLLLESAGKPANGLLATYKQM